MIDFIIGVFNETIYMFLEMAPYIILGLIFVALLNMFVSKDLIIKHVGKNNFVSLLKASLFGIPLPLCSCGVVPTAVYMSKNGASKGATVSFLISTPQTGIDSMIATYGMMGPLFAIFRPLSALITGIVGGMAVKLFDKSDSQLNSKPKFIGLSQLSHKTSKLATKEPIPNKLKQTLNYAFVEFLDDISAQFIVGVIIAGLISYFIPDDYFADSGINSGIWGMLLMIAIGIPMYVCATASIPIAMSLIMKGFSPGVAFVFLAVGPATNAASITIISRSLGKDIVVIYLISISILSIIMGYLLDYFYMVFGEDSITHNHSSHNHGDMFLSDDLKMIIGIIFAIMIAASLYRKYFKSVSDKFLKKEVTNHADIKIKIEGMTCNHCVATVADAAKKINGIDSFIVKLEENAAYVSGTFDMAKLKNEIESSGYKVVD